MEWKTFIQILIGFFSLVGVAILMIMYMEGFWNKKQ